MIKKVIIIGVGLFLLCVVLFGTSALSYVRTSAGYMTDAVRDSVPVEFEIQRARCMIKDLGPEVRRNMHVIAKEEVEVKRLEEQIAKANVTLQKEEGNLKRLRSDLQSGSDVYRYAGRNYSPEQVQVDLANRFERYKTRAATLQTWQKMHEARLRSLEAARQKLEGMLAAKQKLQVEVENLEARMQMVAAAQATSEYQFDDSRLGRVKELIADLQTRLDVADKLVNTETQFYGEIPLEQTTPDDIVDEVTKYFGDGQPVEEAIALH
ncbi:MAG: hypothetical protein A2V70_03820 [Planctomycetes bacterium RBG_13_63_9]|nr:MAG: hypothetical protein A2V70_03820 [Planctomycetes bacterium RBG_13_63_9]